jgi:dTDP-4-dehydrorhamnose 3,5-epimerase
MQVRELQVPGAFEFTPVQHGDDRGLFLEWFKVEKLVEAIGHPMTLAQANLSVSKAGTLRGVHFVDVRVGSPTFGVTDAVRLDSEHRRAVYLPEGVGHAFLALEDDSTLAYLCSTGYAPGREHGITPVDPKLGLALPDGVDFLMSEKDTAAPTLEQAAESGLLPTWDACRQYIASLS